MSEQALGWRRTPPTLEEMVEKAESFRDRYPNDHMCAHQAWLLALPFGKPVATVEEIEEAMRGL